MVGAAESGLSAGGRWYDVGHSMVDGVCGGGGQSRSVGPVSVMDPAATIAPHAAAGHCGPSSMALHDDVDLFYQSMQDNAAAAAYYTGQAGRHGFRSTPGKSLQFVLRH